MANPEIGIVLGTGYADIAKQLLKHPLSVKGDDLDGYPKVDVPGHRNELTLGTVHNRRVLIFEGRKHLYENVPVDDVIYPVVLLKEMGASGVILTNAAGAANPSFRVGQIMLVRDFIESSFGTVEKLVRESLLEIELAEVSADHEWLALARNAAGEKSLDLAEGVYCMNRGPFYETAAEVRACRHWGADAVGMSTVPEFTAARMLGLHVLGVSGMTNMATGLADESHSHEKVQQQSGRLADRLASFLDGFLEEISALS